MRVDAVFVHSCERMPELLDESVDLCVTSPPYWNAIDYDVHTGQPGENYRPRQAVDYRGEYLPFLERCFGEVLRVQKPGSICAVVVGTVLLKGRHHPLPFDLVPRMERLGFEFFQDIIWAKCTAGVKRAGSAVKHPFPGYFYPNIMTEYILLFRKPGMRRIYEGRSKEEKQRARIVVDTVFTKDVANNIWHIAPVPPGQYDHPCPFPEEIPYRLVQWFSYPGDLVLDPFCGIGTTLKVAANLGRRWVGYEVKGEYVREAMRRVGEPLRLREQLVVSYEKVKIGARLPAKNRRRRRVVRNVGSARGGRRLLEGQVGLSDSVKQAG